MRLLALVGLVVLAGCNATPPMPPPVITDPHLHEQTRIIAVHQLLPDVMLVVDRSAGAAPSFEAIRTGVTGMLATRPGAARFGLTAFPNPDAAACGATSAVQLSPISTTDDVPADLTAQAQLLSQQLGNLQMPADARDVAGALGLAAQAFSTQVDRDRFVMLFTTGPEACGADVLAQVKTMRSSQIRTIVIAVGASGMTGYDDIAIAGGFQATCPMGTDAECGVHNTCDASTFACTHAAFLANDVDELESALASITTPVGDSESCRWILDLTPASASRVSVTFNGMPVAQGDNGWTLVSSAEIEFSGTACAQLQSTNPLHPITLVVTVDDRP